MKIPKKIKIVGGPLLLLPLSEVTVVGVGLGGGTGVAVGGGTGVAVAVT